MTLNELVYDLIESVVGTPTDDEEIDLIILSDDEDKNPGAVQTPPQPLMAPAFPTSGYIAPILSPAQPQMGSVAPITGIGVTQQSGTTSK